MRTIYESIVDWETYHKYKTKKTPFTNEIKYDKINIKKYLNEIKEQKRKYKK